MSNNFHSFTVRVIVNISQNFLLKKSCPQLYNMDTCAASRQQFLTIYLFDNGAACCPPERLRVRRGEIDKFLTKEGRSFYYHGKTWAVIGCKFNCAKLLYLQLLAFILWMVKFWSVWRNLKTLTLLCLLGKSNQRNYGSIKKFFFINSAHMNRSPRTVTEKFWRRWKGNIAEKSVKRSGESKPNSKVLSLLVRKNAATWNKNRLILNAGSQSKLSVKHQIRRSHKSTSIGWQRINIRAAIRIQMRKSQQ